MGWTCPKCAKVFAPWVAECRSCNVSTTTTTLPYSPTIWPGGTGTTPQPPYRVTC